VIIRLRDHLIAPDFVIDLKNIPDIDGHHVFRDRRAAHRRAATMTQIATNEHVLRH
jgi:carbon-monoxide dehydrogenase medium subunit